MRALEFTTGHVIYNPAYTYKFQLKTTQEEQMKSLMTKANFDRKTFLFGLGIVQNRVTDIKNASVRELQALRDGLTVKAITGM